MTFASIPLDSNAPRLYKCLSIPAGDYKDVFDLQAIRMVQLHNIIIRAYNSILFYSRDDILPGSKRRDSFLYYCFLANQLVQHHHDNEEENYFPFFEEKLGPNAMSSNASQHLAFQQPFLTFRALVTSMRAKQVPYSATDIYDGVQAFIPILHEHLRDEIGTLKADRLRKYVQEKDLIAMEKAMEAKIKENLSMILDPPLVFVNGDGKHGAWFPEIPAPVAFFIMNVRYYLHYDVWAFGSCDKHRRVKPQFAAYEPELAEKT